MKGLFFGIPIGITSTFWFLMGLSRAIVEHIQSRKKKTIRNKYKISDIAVIIPAHNEEKAIIDCIRAVKQTISPQNIYVASDGSTDKTHRRARAEGCHAVNIMPGKGKAKALVYLIKRFKLYQRYKFVMILDADTRIDKTYIPLALPLFNDPDMSVVFPTARIHWPKHKMPRKELFYIAYRERLNRLLQYFFMYGQTWKYMNASYVAPGFATIYRSRVLRKLNIFFRPSGKTASGRHFFLYQW
jgi:poly-beta-1,6-N-acetyl-D-glucosamine synthase